MREHNRGYVHFMLSVVDLSYFTEVHLYYLFSTLEWCTIELDICYDMRFTKLTVLIIRTNGYVILYTLTF